jgi:hypothetical protein
MAAGVSLNNLSKIFRFNPDIGAFDWMSGWVSHNPFKGRRPSPSTERYNE